MNLPASGGRLPHYVRTVTSNLSFEANAKSLFFSPNNPAISLEMFHFDHQRKRVWDTYRTGDFKSGACRRQIANCTGNSTAAEGDRTCLEDAAAL